MDILVKDVPQMNIRSAKLQSLVVSFTEDGLAELMNHEDILLMVGLDVGRCVK